MELDDLFNEVAPLIKKTAVKAGLEPYGRGKDYDLTAVQADIASGYRICTRCQEHKTIDNFSKRSAHVTGYKAWCKSCDSIAFAQHRNKNLEQSRERERASQYKSAYGLDAGLAKILANKDNRIAPCPICRQTEHLVLDHDHQTGVVRSLICSSCNTMLGMARDSLDILYEAIAYLKKHRGL